MKKKILALAFVLCSSFLVTNLYSNISAVDPNLELQKKNKEDSNKIKELNKEVEDKKHEISDAEKQIEEVSNKITEISQRIAESETKLHKLNKDLVKIKEEINELTKKENKTKNDMKLRIQYMYENSNQNIVVLFLKENSFSDFLNGAEYKSKITSYDRKKLQEYKKLKEEIKEKETAQKKLVDEQASIKDSLVADKKEAETLMEEQKKLIEENKDVVSNLTAEIEELQKSIQGRNEQIQANIKAAQEKLAELKRKQAANGGIGNTSVTIPSNGTVASSGYLWPLPSNYTTITSPFSSGRRLVAADYVNGGHLGVDIGAPTGTPIYAARSGVVVWSNYDAVSGNMVCIIQDDGRISRYAHMSSTAVGVNQTVSQGQVIGYVGMTGSATGPHLHFQVETDPNAMFGSTAFDPLILY